MNKAKAIMSSKPAFLVLGVFIEFYLFLSFFFFSLNKKQEESLRLFLLCVSLPWREEWKSVSF